MSRVVLITGSSSGIGLATSIAFANAGDTVYATMRDPGRGQALETAAQAAGVSVRPLALDVRDDRSVQDAVDRIVSEHGRIDVVVNNAGLASSGTLEELSIEDLRAPMEVNYFGVARVTKAVLPLMREARQGRIIAVSSMAGAFGQPFNEAYCASKCALEGMYESLAPVAEAFGIFVSLVEPGPVAGEFREHMVGVDRRSAGDPYSAQWQRFLTVTDGGYEQAESPAHVAEVIVEVAGADAPKLRYQTTPFVEKLIGFKLADTSGDRILGMTRRWLA